MSEKKMTPQERYNKKNLVQVVMRLNRKYDSDLLEYLEESGNKQGTLKLALREYIENHK